MGTSTTAAFENFDDGRSGHESLHHEIVRCERLLDLAKTSPGTQVLFTSLRVEIDPEQYLRLLAELTGLAAAWLSAHYRYTGSLPDEFARAWRGEVAHGITPGLDTIERLHEELTRRAAGV